MKERLEHYTVDELDDQTVRIVEQSHPTIESAASMHQDVLLLQEKRKRALCLIDLSFASIPSSSVRSELIDMFRDAQFEKIAVFGVSTPIRVVAQFVMGTGGFSNYKFFPTKVAAIEWLHNTE